MLACISGCGGVIGCIVAAGGVLCAKKFALHTKNGSKSAFCGALGEFFAITPLERSRRAKFFAGLHKRPRAGRIKLCHRGSWHALRLSVSPARRADHSQAEADRA